MNGAEEVEVVQPEGDKAVFGDDEELVFDVENGRVAKIRFFEAGLGRFYDRRLYQKVREGPIPRHIAIIMDGNRRFALDMGVEKKAGHRVGKEKVRQVMRWSRDIGVRYLTVYALSVENLGRHAEELEELYSLYESGFLELAEDREIHRDKVRCQAVGKLQLMPQRVRKAISIATEATRNYEDMVFTVCLAYGGRQELVDAIRGMVGDHAKGKIAIDDIDEDLVSRYLYTSDLPDPDMVLRTSGESRVSNFLLWQLAYAELFFTDVYWPAFRKRDFLRALRTYQSRQRRYGT